MDGVFNYQDSKTFFRDFKNALQGNHGVSVAKLSQSLGYKSPRTVGMVMDGSRLPSDEIITRISSNFRFTQMQTDYLKLLVSRDRLRRRRRGVPAELDREIFRRQQIHQPQLESVLKTEPMPDWTHWVLRQLLGSKAIDELDLKEQLQLLVNRFSEQTESQILEQLQILHSSNLIQKNKLGGYQNVTRLQAGDTKPSPSIRRVHKQFLERAIHSLENDPIVLRKFRSLCLLLDPSKIEEADDFVKKFVREFNTRFASSRTTSVYQLNVQLFPQSLAKDNS